VLGRAAYTFEWDPNLKTFNAKSKISPQSELESFMALGPISPGVK
jgi:hypothetical protein